MHKIEHSPTRYWIMPYVIESVKLFAVETPDRYILKYCDTEKDAKEYIKQL